MSKKMMKRSLALGALMAFVITGSAMAAELTISSNEDYAAAKNNKEWFGGSKIYSQNSSSNNTLTIGNVTNIDVPVYVGYNGGYDLQGQNVDAIANGNELNINGNINIANGNNIPLSPDIICAAYATGNTKAEVSNNKVFVSGAEVISQDNSGIVSAGFAVSSYKKSKVETVATGNTITVKDNAKVNSVYGAYAVSIANSSKSSNAEASATANVKSNSVTVTGGEVNGNVYGAYAESVIQNVKNSEKQSATANLKENSVTVSNGTVNGNVYGAYAIAKHDQATSIIDGILNANADNNTVNLSGGTIVGDVYGGYSVEITDCKKGEDGEELGTASNNSINISGTANVENANLYGNNGGEGTGNTLNISAWGGSIGSAQNFDVINITEGASASFKTALNDANATVNVKGATWNVDKASTIGSASFDASSVLNIDGATFEAKDSNNVYALNGSGELKVAEGATLAIKGIDYKKYNVANGFSSIVDGNGNKFTGDGEYWKLENTLMQGVWTTDNGLQVEIKAKEAEDLAEDLGVSETTGEFLGNLVEGANVSNAKPNDGSAQGKLVGLANAAANSNNPVVVAKAAEAVQKMAEAGGNSATAANVVNNVTNVTGQRMSFTGGNNGNKGGHGVGLFEEGSGAAIWAQYVHGKDSVENMPSEAGASSYEGQYNGIVMGVDFKKVGKFQSGIAFNYGEGDTHSVNTTSPTRSDYDFWGIGYYGNIRNADSNVIFDIGYAKTDSDVTSNVIMDTYNETFEASPETTTWTAGVKVEKLYQNNNVQIVPYTGLRYMSIDPEDYSTKCGAMGYKMERQDIWLLPLGVSIRQEVVNDNGWVVTPKVDLSYIWAFGDTDSTMETNTVFGTDNRPVGYDVMDDGSWLGLVGVEASMDDWTFGVSYSYQKGDHSESKKWYVDAKYSF